MGNGGEDSQRNGRSGQSDRGNEEHRPVEMGGNDEQLSSLSSGNNNQGTDRNRITEEAEDIASSAFVMPENKIKDAIHSGFTQLNINHSFSEKQRVFIGRLESYAVKNNITQDIINSAFANVPAFHAHYGKREYVSRNLFARRLGGLERELEANIAEHLTATPELKVGDVYKVSSPDESAPFEKLLYEVTDINEYTKSAEFKIYNEDDTGLVLNIGGGVHPAETFLSDHPEFEYMGTADSLREADHIQNRELYEALSQHKTILFANKENKDGNGYPIEDARATKATNIRLSYLDNPNEADDKGYCFYGDTPDKENVVLLYLGEIPPESIALDIRRHDLTVSGIEDAVTLTESADNVLSPSAAEQPVNGENSLVFHFGKGNSSDEWFTESGLLHSFVTETMQDKPISFALGNAVLEYLDEKQHTERSIEGLNAGWYKKTDFTISAVVNGHSHNYEGRYDIGDGKGTGGGSLIDHIIDFNTGIITSDQYPYNSMESKEQANNVLHELVPFLKENAVLTTEEQQILIDFKAQNPIRTPMSETDYMEIAKDTINTFCMDEYGQEADFSDLSNISVAYSTVTDEDINVQVNIDLEKAAVNYYIGDRLFKSNEYNSIAELQDKFLSAMSFDEMVSFNESDAEILAFFNNTHTNSTENTFEIYQLKSGDELRYHRFTDIETLHNEGNKVDFANYEKVYESTLGDDTKLEDIFTQFNIAHPEDFKGHSLSVSDVIVLNKNDGSSAYYVDDIGFPEVPEFIQTMQNPEQSAVSSVYLEKYDLTLDFKEISSLDIEWSSSVYLGGIDSDGHERKDNYTERISSISFYDGDYPDMLIRYDGTDEYSANDYPVPIADAAAEIENYLDKSIDDKKISVYVHNKDGSEDIIDAKSLIKGNEKTSDTANNEEQLSFFSDNNAVSEEVEKPVNDFQDVVEHIENMHKDAPAAEKPIIDNKPIINKIDFTITNDNLGEGGAKTKYRANVEAIKTLKAIESENRLATADEQKILSQYVGWGGLKNAFEDHHQDWQNEYAELKELLTPEEYSSAAASTLNAHYTSPVVIDKMYEALSNNGFNGGRILEPAMGVGNFFGKMPDDIRSNSRLYGVELDDISGRIAQQLYQTANIRITGFEKAMYSNNSFDLAIGNVPFGGYSLNEATYNKYHFQIHDHFFAKSLDIFAKKCYMSMTAMP